MLANSSVGKVRLGQRHLQLCKGQQQDVVSSNQHSRIILPDSIREQKILSVNAHPEIYCGRAEGPPASVMESFQGVVSKLFLSRIIRCGGSVDNDMANLIVAQLLYLDSVDQKKDVTMYINSPGGSVTAGMAVFDTMRHVRPDVSTVVVGLAASMGAFLLAAGQMGKRYALANSRIMIHQPLGSTQGTVEDIEIQANEILHHKLTLNGYLAEFTGQPLEQIDMDTDNDFYMSPPEAVEYGLVDAVISKPQLTEAFVPPTPRPPPEGPRLFTGAGGGITYNLNPTTM